MRRHQRWSGHRPRHREWLGAEGAIVVVVDRVEEGVTETLTALQASNVNASKVLVAPVIDHDGNLRIPSSWQGSDGGDPVAGKEIAVREVDVVRLDAEERDRLNELIRKGKRSAQLLTKVRILLKADVSDAGAGWSDSRIAAALVTTSTRHRRADPGAQLVEERVGGGAGPGDSGDCLSGLGRCKLHYW